MTATARREPKNAARALPPTLAEELATHLPTPLYYMGEAGFWVKDDGVTSGIYGGNKVRKLGRVFERAQARGSVKLLTIGAAGSHHVLTTGLFAPAYGLEATALLTPQWETPHVRATLAASVASGMQLIPCDTAPAGIATAVAKLATSAHPLSRTTTLVGPGGLSGVAAWGYADAAQEVLRQVQERDHPAPEWVVVACGSGGTAAGLCVGFAQASARTRVLAVAVARSALHRPLVLAQARALLALKRAAGERVPKLTEVTARLVVTDGFVGAGYGRPCPEAEAARELAARAGLELDGTYTAKAFAAAQDRARQGAEGLIYWHTLSRTTPRTEPGRALPSDLERLLLRPSR